MERRQSLKRKTQGSIPAFPESCLTELVHAPPGAWRHRLGFRTGWLCVCTMGEISSLICYFYDLSQCGNCLIALVVAGMFSNQKQQQKQRKNPKEQTTTTMTNNNNSSFFFFFFLVVFFLSHALFLGNIASFRRSTVSMVQ